MRRQGAEGVPYDVFKPELIETALVCHELGLGALIFGESKWSAFCQSTEQLQGQGGGAAMQPPNPLSKYFDCDDCDNCDSARRPRMIFLLERNLVLYVIRITL